MRFVYTYEKFVCGKLHSFVRQFHSKREYDEQTLAKLVRQKYGKDSKLVSWEKQIIEPKQ